MMQSTTVNEPLNLQRTSKGAVLFGSRPDNGEWLERWFKSADAARGFAEKKGWSVVEKAKPIQ